MTGSMRVVAVVPAYNCEKTVGRVVEGLRGPSGGVGVVDSVIVVDDGSSDGTARAAEAAGAHVVRHPENHGLGSALRTGFAEALAGDYQIIVTLDADGQHSPADVGRIITRLEVNHCHLVIGSRLVDRSQWRRFPPLRLIGNLLLTTLTNAALGHRATTDSQSGYRAFLREVLEEVPLSATHMAIASEIVVEVTRAGFQIAEVPIDATYESEVSAQRVVLDPLTIAAMLFGKLWRRGPLRKAPARAANGRSPV